MTVWVAALAVCLCHDLIPHGARKGALDYYEVIS